MVLVVPGFGGAWFWWLMVLLADGFVGACAWFSASGFSNF